MAKLADKRVTIGYTPEEMQEIESLTNQLKNKIKTPPTMSDDEFDALPKMGDVKRKSFGDKLPILQKYPKALEDASDVAYAELSLSFFDQSKQISNWLKACDDKNWRSGDVAGFQAMNQISYYEKEISRKSDSRNEAAIEANNEFQRLKPTKVAAADKPATPDAPNTKK